MPEEPVYKTVILGMDPAATPENASVVFMGSTTDKLRDMKVIGFSMGDKFFQYADDGTLFEVMPSQDDFHDIELTREA